MRALRIEAIGRLGFAEVPDPAPGPGEAVVVLRAAALNRRDLWIKLGKYAGLRFPCIPGSDGAGVVSAAGEGVDPAWVGREVVINPGLSWGASPRAQSPAFEILGLPRDGTLADQVAVPASQLAAKPAHLSWEQAAALPLAGLTAWRALATRAGLAPGDRVLVSGIGGGVALFALQFAAAMGNEVWVSSGSDEKIARASSLGAAGGFRYDAPGWASAAAKAAGPFDVIIDGAGGAGLSDLLDLAAPGARIALYGATGGNAPDVALRKVFWKQLSIVGSTMGSPDDWAAMYRFVGQHRIVPVVSDVFAFPSAGKAFDLMERGGQFGKIVVRH
jgi:NADPH:quinone reductase-like Zn-dependent oxidoreductase